MGTHPLFKEEHEALRQSIRRFVDTELAPHAEEWEEAEWFADWVFPRMGELGYLGLRYPEQYGGQGGDYACAIVLAEEMTRHGAGGLPMAVAVQSEMATPPVFKFGTEEQKQRFLAPAIRGTKIACLAITEPDAGSDVAGLKTWAKRDGPDWVINGTKLYITNGVRADFCVLVARTAEGRYDGVTLFLVEKGTPGFGVGRKLKKLGMKESDTAELVFQEVRVPQENVLGEVNQGFYHLMWELQGERLIAAAGAVAGAQRCLEEAIRFAQQRRAFGQRIVDFQVWRHRIADAATEIEAARQLTYNVALRWQQGEYLVRDITMAKLFAAQVECKVADMCLQMHGGAGYMLEYPVQRHWRDSRLVRIGAGTDEIMREIIAKSLDL